MKVISADEAVAAIPDGATVTFSGSAGVGVTESLFKALANRYKHSGHPRDLTLFFPVEAGSRLGEGMDRLAQPGMLRRLVGGAFIFTGSEEPPATVRMICDNEVEAYNLPMGVMFHLCRQAAAKRPGLLSRVGLDTFYDPIHGGGKLNPRTREDLVERVSIGGEPLLFYKAPRIDVALIRGTAADEDGNISLAEEASLLGSLAQAMAAKGCGGIVIAQVGRLVRKWSINAKDVRIPGILVDAVVLDPSQEQVAGAEYDPSLSGEMATVAPAPSLEDIPLAHKVIARRAACELADGAVVNVGFGIGALVPRVIANERPNAHICFLVEQGAIGGTPLNGLAFGVARNPTAFLDMPSWFDFIDGGQFDATCLGLGEIDQDGNVNNHWIGNILTGCGGFVDITSNARKIIFCSTLTSGGLKAHLTDGKLVVSAEGRHQKLVPRVRQITLNGRRALEKGQKVIIVTERAVFELRTGGPTLVELAPGIGIQQVAALAGFPLKCADNVAAMPQEIFQ